MNQKTIVAGQTWQIKPTAKQTWRKNILTITDVLIENTFSVVGTEELENNYPVASLEENYTLLRHPANQED